MGIGPAALGRRPEMTNKPRTWTITDAHGVRRDVTLAQFLAEHEAHKAAAKPIADAWRSGDIKATEQAQTTYRKRFA